MGENARIRSRGTTTGDARPGSSGSSDNGVVKKGGYPMGKPQGGMAPPPQNAGPGAKPASKPSKDG